MQPAVLSFGLKKFWLLPPIIVPDIITNSDQLYGKIWDSGQLLILSEQDALQKTTAVRVFRHSKKICEGFDKEYCLLAILSSIWSFVGQTIRLPHAYQIQLNRNCSKIKT